MTGRLIEINLLPVEYRKIKKDYSFLLDAKIVIPSLALIVVFATFAAGKSYIANNLSKNEDRLAVLKADIGRNKSVLVQIEKLETLLKEKNAKNQSLKSISLNKQLWVRVLEGINIALPPNSWIQEIRQSRKNPEELSLMGATYLFSEVALYMIDLEENEYFVNVVLDQVEIDPAGDSHAFFFALKINLNLNLGAERPVAPDTLVRS